MTVVGNKQLHFFINTNDKKISLCYNTFIITQEGDFKMKSKNNTGCLKFILVVAFFLVCIFEAKEKNNEEDSDYTIEETESSTENDTQEETRSDRDFISVLSGEVGDDVAKEVDSILNQIGFTEIEYEQQLGETSNYEIVADGIHLVITVMEDYYRVFIPYTSYIFYEEGQVVMTAEEYKDKNIDNNDAIVYYIMAQDIISQSLVNPNSADFPSLTFNAADIAFAKTGDVITVQSYVDAKNALNATVRSNWTVQFIPLDMDTYTYEVTYINIGGDKVGTYTEIN